MGPTGSGKTTFIDHAIGSPDAGHGSTSYTKEVRTVRHPHSDGVRSIVLVDTPGCNNSFMTDFQVLAEIAWWLRSSYKKNIKLHGILYFHPISDHIIRETVSRNYTIFKALCGKDYCKNVIFVTTMWDQVSAETGSERERDLQSDFWRAMINLGSTTRRFKGTMESAWNIINSLSVPQAAERCPLQIQREMVEDYLPLQLTTAGRAITDRILSLVSDLKHLRKGPKRSSRTTRITITLTDDPTATQSAGTGIFNLSNPENCSVEGYQSALAHVIRALRAATGGPELVHLNYIRDAIGVCLDIALSIVPMTGTHHAFFQTVEIATLLINVIVEYVKQVTQERISADITTAISEFAK
ncbi:hypothetical protein EDD15DRAFT_2582453 [Pisolithus albus]|nr:hypothetical protein EDD15DRAFT_2582453 [Pisolithus albus]